MSGHDLTFLKNPLILLIVRVGPVLILKCLWSIFTNTKYDTQNVVFCMTKLYILLGKIIDHFACVTWIERHVLKFFKVICKALQSLSFPANLLRSVLPFPIVSFWLPL